MRAVKKSDKISRRRGKYSRRIGYKCSCWKCLGKETARFSKREVGQLAEPIVEPEHDIDEADEWTAEEILEERRKLHELEMGAEP